MSNFSSHQEQIRTWLDPRLMNRAVYRVPDKYGIEPHASIRNNFRDIVKARKVLEDVDLSDKVVIVTGANSGLGEYNVFAC